MKIRKFKIILSIFLIIGIAVGGMLGYYDARLEASVNQGKSLNSVDVGDNLTFNKDVVNILLVGSDHGAIKGDHGRSDSIMIATVNFKSKELKLTSLMRDMYVEIPGHGHNKLNAAYAFGGVELLYKTIAKNFGIKIDNYCVVDLSGNPDLEKFAQAYDMPFTRVKNMDHIEAIIEDFLKNDETALMECLIDPMDTTK